MMDQQAFQDEYRAFVARLVHGLGGSVMVTEVLSMAYAEISQAGDYSRENVHAVVLGIVIDLRDTDTERAIRLIERMYPRRPVKADRLRTFQDCLAELERPLCEIKFYERLVTILFLVYGWPMPVVGVFLRELLLPWREHLKPKIGMADAAALLDNIRGSAIERLKDYVVEHSWVDKVLRGQVDFTADADSLAYLRAILAGGESPFARKRNSSQDIFGKTRDAWRRGKDCLLDQLEYNWFYWPPESPVVVRW